MRGSTPIHLHLRRRLILVFGATFVVAIFGALAIYFLERHAPARRSTATATALFWTSAQLLTVSSQLKNPISTGGRVLDIFFEAWAISVVAVAGRLVRQLLHAQESRAGGPRAAGGGGSGQPTAAGRSAALKKSRIRRVTSSGCSSSMKWPQSGTNSTSKSSAKRREVAAHHALRDREVVLAEEEAGRHGQALLVVALARDDAELAQ